MTNLQDPKVVPVNGLPDSMVEGGTGFNPEPEEIIYPKLKKGQRLTPEINATREDWRLYHKYKHDMHTQAFFMGPGKSNQEGLGKGVARRASSIIGTEQVLTNAKARFATAVVLDSVPGWDFRP